MHNDGSNVSTCSLDLEAHENLKSHFNERLNDRVYSTFKELFSKVNVDSIKEVLPQIKVYNNTIASYMEEINLKYGVTLRYTHLEFSEIGHWAETFQVATHSNDPQQPPQPQQPTLQVTIKSPQVQVPLLRDQQAKIDRLTIWYSNGQHGSHKGLITQTFMRKDTNLQDTAVPQICPQLHRTTTGNTSK